MIRQRDGHRALVRLLLEVIQLHGSRSSPQTTRLWSQSLHRLFGYASGLDQDQCVPRKSLHKPSCVHSDDVLARPKFKVLKCPQCGKTHTLGVNADVSAVNLNYAVYESLQRLHQTGTVGGLLPSESVVLGQQPIVTSQHSAVYPAVLRMDDKQIQVWCVSFA